MSNLVQTLLSIKSPYDSFIDKPELIQGYTEDEIKEIEQKYNLPIHGQFKEFLMTMGKCSGGLVAGSEIYIYRDGGIEHYIDDYVIESIQEDIDYEYLMKFLDNVDLVEKRFLIFAGINEHMVRYFMLAANNNDIVYEWDTNEDTVREFGTLFDFLIWHREGIYRTVVENSKYPMYGRLL